MRRMRALGRLERGYNMTSYIVYCLKNKLNNKKYIGVTSQTPCARWQNGKHYSRHKKLYNDILKYGGITLAMRFYIQI